MCLSQAYYGLAIRIYKSELEAFVLRNDILEQMGKARTQIVGGETYMFKLQ